jgi:anti-sigma B factor antagonist
MDADLEVVHPQRDAAVVVLRGEHDLASADSLRKTFTGLLDMHQLVVADLSIVEFIDSSVLAELVRADRKADSDGKQFRLQLGTEPIVKRVLEISGLLAVLDCHPTREEALNAC